MNERISFHSYPVNVVLKFLLQDKTTKKNIVFATNAYTEKDSSIDERTQITESILKGLDAAVIQPRAAKSLEHRAERTRKKAEVFTPSWICNKMNNYCDEEWFGEAGLFNTETERDWVVNRAPIPFKRTRDWQKYVDSKRLEITCGEAPYLASRYDAATGEMIPMERRIGILDRKLRVVKENAETESEWMKWVTRAYQSVYGYEYQGDNLLIARVNLFITFVEYMEERWNRIPTDAEMKKIANIVAWNLWQMDGITGTVPFGKPEEEYTQLSLFDSAVEHCPQEKPTGIECKIFDWRSNESITYNSIKEGKQR